MASLIATWTPEQKCIKNVVYLGHLLVFCILVKVHHHMTVFKFNYQVINQTSLISAIFVCALNCSCFNSKVNQRLPNSKGSPIQFLINHTNHNFLMIFIQTFIFTFIEQLPFKGDITLFYLLLNTFTFHNKGCNTHHIDVLKLTAQSNPHIFTILPQINSYYLTCLNS